MKCEESFITIKLIWHNYLIFSLGNYVIKLCTETGLRAGLVISSTCRLQGSMSIVVGPGGTSQQLLLPVVHWCSSGAAGIQRIRRVFSNCGWTHSEALAPFFHRFSRSSMQILVDSQTVIIVAARAKVAYLHAGSSSGTLDRIGVTVAPSSCKCMVMTLAHQPL